MKQGYAESFHFNFIKHKQIVQLVFTTQCCIVSSYIILPSSPKDWNVLYSDKNLRGGSQIHGSCQSAPSGWGQYIPGVQCCPPSPGCVGPNYPAWRSCFPSITNWNSDGPSTNITWILLLFFVFLWRFAQKTGSQNEAEIFHFCLRELIWLTKWFHAAWQPQRWTSVTADRCFVLFFAQCDLVDFLIIEQFVCADIKFINETRLRRKFPF